MTIHLPLKASNPPPQNPSFLVQPHSVSTHLSKAIQAIVKARRLVVVCGAGISVQAGIPDFRSSDGLFKSLRRDNPRESLSSGKDLFDASVFTSEQTTALFCQMIARLSELSHLAQPTPFHRALRTLDDHGKLLRVYTQNIDAIEEKCGLSFGVPEFDGKRYRPRGKGKSGLSSASIPSTSAFPCYDTENPRLPSPPVETPRCIPLHGTLQSMHCQICNNSFPLQDYIPALVAGQPPECPECTSLEQTRQLIGKRPRGIGKLRPSVVLYNEDHKDGEGVGDVVSKDLIGSSKGKGRSGADVLLVVGTSLQVPGTKRMVREFAKAVRSRGVGSTYKEDSPSSGPSSRAPSPGRTSTVDEDTPIKAIYLNLDFPVPTREWEGVFDAWIQGDAQQFAELLQQELERDSTTKALAAEKKRKRKEDAMRIVSSGETMSQGGAVTTVKSADVSSNASKRLKISFPPSPPRTPPANERTLNINAGPSSSRLVVRIPPLSNIRRLVPEVCITTPPPSDNTTRKAKGKDRAQLPLTPEKTPVRLPSGKKSGKKTAHPALQAAKLRCHQGTQLPTVDNQGVDLPGSTLLSAPCEVQSAG